MVQKNFYALDETTFSPEQLKTSDMKKYFVIERDEKGVAKWDTFPQRFAFAFRVITTPVLAVLIAASFAWAIYWLITGKSIWKSMID